MLGKNILAWGLSGVSILVTSMGANAAVWEFSYKDIETNGAQINAFGQIITDEEGTTIIDLIGTRNGLSITLLPPNTFPANNLSNDNVFVPSGDPSFVTYYGLSYKTDEQHSYNFFYNTDVNSLSYSEDPTGLPSDYQKVSATFTSVPEPVNILGVVTVIGAGLALKRKLT